MIAKVKKRWFKISKCYNQITLVVVRTTKKIVGPPDPLSWWSCGPLLIKVCVKPWLKSTSEIQFLFDCHYVGPKCKSIIMIVAFHQVFNVAYMDRCTVCTGMLM